MMALARILALGTALLFAGCAPEPRKMDWQAVLEDAGR